MLCLCCSLLRILASRQTPEKEKEDVNLLSEIHKIHLRWVTRKDYFFTKTAVIYTVITIMDESYCYMILACTERTCINPIVTE